MKYVNLTPNALSILSKEGLLEVPRSDSVAKVDEISTYHTTEDNVDIYLTKYGKIFLCGKTHFYPPRNELRTPFPPEEEGTIYIVSKRVRQAMPHRTDVMSPGLPIHDENGQLIGYRGLHANNCGF